MTTTTNSAAGTTAVHDHKEQNQTPDQQTEASTQQTTAQHVPLQHQQSIGMRPDHLPAEESVRDSDIETSENKRSATAVSQKREKVDLKPR